MGVKALRTLTVVRLSLILSNFCDILEVVPNNQDSENSTNLIKIASVFLLEVQHSKSQPAAWALHETEEDRIGNSNCQQNLLGKTFQSSEFWDSCLNNFEFCLAGRTFSLAFKTCVRGKRRKRHCCAVKCHQSGFNSTLVVLLIVSPQSNVDCEEINEETNENQIMWVWRGAWW
jgi:hypothetical protein